jgi:hypothetical protein
MRKNFQFKYLIAIFLPLIFIACEKHTMDKEPALEGAAITISEPTAGATYQLGDSISIRAKAIYKQNIHGYDLAIRKTNDTTVYYFIHVHDHNDTLLVDQKWKNTLSGPLNMEAELTFYLDHDGTTGIRKATFNIE